MSELGLLKYLYFFYLAGAKKFCWHGQFSTWTPDGQAPFVKANRRNLQSKVKGSLKI